MRRHYLGLKTTKETESLQQPSLLVVAGTIALRKENSRSASCKVKSSIKGDVDVEIGVSRVRSTFLCNRSASLQLQTSKPLKEQSIEAAMFLQRTAFAAARRAAARPVAVRSFATSLARSTTPNSPQTTTY
jgi:hypothetical protein